MGRGTCGGCRSPFTRPASPGPPPQSEDELKSFSLWKGSGKTEAPAALAQSADSQLKVALARNAALEARNAALEARLAALGAV